MTRMEKTILKLASKLKFVPASETRFKSGLVGFDKVAFNGEYVLFTDGETIEWVSMNGHYSGSFRL